MRRHELAKKKTNTFSITMQNFIEVTVMVFPRPDLATDRQSFGFVTVGGGKRLVCYLSTFHYLAPLLLSYTHLDHWVNTFGGRVDCLGDD